MTREQVIELAKQVEAELDARGNGSYNDICFTICELELYTKLVRNAALEEAAQVCESRQTPGTGSVAILTGAVDAIRNLKEPT